MGGGLLDRCNELRHGDTAPQRRRGEFMKKMLLELPDFAPGDFA